VKVAILGGGRRSFANRQADQAVLIEHDERHGDVLCRQPPALAKHIAVESQLGRMMLAPPFQPTLERLLVPRAGRFCSREFQLAEAFRRRRAPSRGGR
jgi:hypothetical protein